MTLLRLGNLRRPPTAQPEHDTSDAPDDGERLVSMDAGR